MSNILWSSRASIAMSPLPRAWSTQGYYCLRAASISLAVYWEVCTKCVQNGLPSPDLPELDSLSSYEDQCELGVCADKR